MAQSGAPGEDSSRRPFPVLRLGYVYPVSGTLPSVSSLSGELSVIFEHGPLFVEPRIALRRSFERHDEWFAEVPMDVGLFVRWPQGDIYQFLGAGIGGHYWMMQRVVGLDSGETLVSGDRSEIGSTFAFGGFARAGFGVKPSRATSLFVTGDVEVTTGDLFGKGPHWLTAVDVGFGFGESSP